MQIWSSINQGSRTDVITGDIQISGISGNLVYLTDDTSDNTEEKRKIWLCSNGKNKAEILVDSGKIRTKDPEATISNIRTPEFNIDGTYIYIRLNRKEKREVSHLATVTVWNYRDRVLQNSQPYQDDQLLFVYAVDLNSGILNKLADPFQNLDAVSRNGKFAVVTEDTSGDRFWIDRWSGKGITTTWLIRFLAGKGHY